ncbi:MAG: methyltransferase [Vicinamibacterales bacterium]|nr:methyltransferase [Vicinamibacterales bacterium]
MPPGPLLTGLTFALLLIAATSFIVYGLALSHFYRRPAVLTTGTRVHHILAIAFALAHVFTLALTSPPSASAAVAGLALYASGLALFFWAQETVKANPPMLAFADDPPSAPCVTGPYRIVRHPFYAALMLTWVAGAVAVASVWLLAIAAGMTTLYVVAARREEAQYLRSGYAEAYAAYRARTGMFVPRLRVETGRPSRPLWTEARDADEDRPVLGPLALVLAILLVLLIAAGLISRALDRIQSVQVERPPATTGVVVPVMAG